MLQNARKQNVLMRMCVDFNQVKSEQFFDIVNSFRADAHAKELSEEDEAILNIAFKYFENALKDF